MTAAASAVPLAEVLLIDLSSLYWTSWHATKDSSVSEAASLTSAAIRRAVGNSGALVAICCDQGRSFRKTLSPDYKANRPEKDQSALSELDRLKERLRDDGYWLVGADGFEADDVIATLATAASSKGHPIRIASADKDLLQLLALPDSSALRTFNDWATVRSVDVVTKFGVDPEGLRDWLALVGDTSDNIKGCPSVGAKTATTLLLAHFDIDGIYAKVDALSFGDTTSPAAKAIATPAIVGKLAAHKADVMLARKLVTLRTDAPVSLDPIYERHEPKTTPLENIDMDGPDDDETPAPMMAMSKGQAIPVPPAVAAAIRAEEVKSESPKASAAGVDATGPGVFSEEPAPSAAPASSSQIVAPPSNGTSTSETRVTVIAPYERQLEPTSGGSALKLAQVLYESRAFTRFPTPGALCAAIIGGRELGLGAIAATNAFHFMNEMGCLALKAHTIIELGITHPKCEYIRLIHSDEVFAEYETKHRDHAEPFRWTFTAAQAVQMGLCAAETKPRPPLGTKDTRGMWDKDRPGMIRKTCGIQIVRITYPGAAQGFYGIEELGGDE